MHRIQRSVRARRLEAGKLASNSESAVMDNTQSRYNALKIKSAAARRAATGRQL
jgi:hypothetical protein